MDTELKKLKQNNKKKIILLALTMVMFLGISLGAVYFIYHVQDERENKLKTGLVSVEFTDSATINLENTVPMIDDLGLENDPYIFTVKNTSNIPINLNLQIEPDNNNTLPTSAIRYGFYANDKLIEKGNLGSLDENGNFYVYENFRANETLNCKLVFWVDYYYETPGQSFSGKIKVIGESFDIIYEPTAAEVIIEKVVPYAVSNASDFTGGLVGINTSGTLYNETTTDEVREYRYSGPSLNNYAYFNCKDTDGTYNYGDDNYDYANNCETWRVIGIFKNNNNEWNLKLMRNTILTTDELPATYVVDGTTYTIENGTTGYAYWNNPDTLKSTNYNDWWAAGLQYFLNTESDTNGTAGYYSTLSSGSKELIDENYTYHLGNFAWDIDTTITGYSSERDGNNRWEGNEPSWNGAVALLYPSDYGYSALSSNWNTEIYKYKGGVSVTSWMQKEANHTTYELLLSPSSLNDDYAVYLYSDGGVFNSYVIGDCYGVRPVLNLKSNIKILKGEGTQEKPYVFVS